MRPFLSSWERKELRLPDWVEMRKTVAALTGHPDPLGTRVPDSCPQTQAPIMAQPATGSKPGLGPPYSLAPCAVNDSFTNFPIFFWQAASFIVTSAAAR